MKCILLSYMNKKQSLYGVKEGPRRRYPPIFFS